MTIGSHNGEPCTFYGSLLTVILLHFRRGYSTFLFKCEWYNSDPKKMKFDYHLTSLNVNNQWYIYDPYVLPNQAHKVFYLDDPKLGHPWKVVQKIQYRHVWDVPEREEDEDHVNHDGDYDDDDGDTNDVWEVQVEDDETNTSLCRHDVEPEIIILTNTDKERSVENDDNFIDDDSTDDDLMLEDDRASNEEELLVDSDTNSG